MPARVVAANTAAEAFLLILQSITVENACLWWTGKQLQQEELLSKYLGTNEKTKTVVRLQPKSAGKRQPLIPSF